MFTEHVADAALSSYGETAFSDEEIYTRDIAWLTESDVVVAEVTSPSLGVGYELATAHAQGKPKLCLWRPQVDRSLSPMIAGAKYFTIRSYADIGELPKIFDEFFAHEALSLRATVRERGNLSLNE